MAKSMRSKPKRKLLALKRRRNFGKVREQLEKVINLDVKSISSPFVTREALLNSEKSVNLSTTPVEMEQDAPQPDENKGSISIRNEHGNYPVWMNKRERRRQVSLYRKKKRNKK